MSSVAKNSEMQTANLPSGFCYLNDYAPNIVADIKYSTADNFTGQVVEGYKANVVICTIQAAEALGEVNDELNTLGLGLKVFDAYRPAKACKSFKKWATNGMDDIELKARFYPDIDKPDLLKGYIAEFSNHSRGSTVDVTIIRLETGAELEMGAEFDFFGKKSHTKSADITESEAMNRQLLVDVMDKYGFNNYKNEWWHYELRDEPFPRDQDYSNHFDFDVE